MKKILIAFILVCFSINIYSQNLESELIQKSLHFIKLNDLKNFRKTYPKLYFAYLKDNLPQYQNAIKDVNSNQYESAFKNLDSLITDDIFLDEISFDKNFKKLHAHPEWKKLINKINLKKSKYDNNLRQQLKIIQNEDQGIRVLYISLDKNIQKELRDKIHNEMKFVDNKSSQFIQKFIDKYGWIGPDKIGAEANRTIFLAIQHVDDLIVQEKYLPVLEKAVKEKKAEPWNLAFLTDRIRMNQGKKQVYGSQVITYRSVGKSYIVPLENPEKVDELRKEVGLQPLNDYLKAQGLNWNLQEYLKNLPENERLYKENFEKHNSR